jgi:hypothetical protein
MKTIQSKTLKSFISAGTFLGMGIGFLLGNLVAYMFLGMGLGYVVYAISNNKKEA